MEYCVFCALVVAPADPHRRKIPQTNSICHDYCQKAAYMAALRRRIMDEHCPLCHRRISNWMIATGKTSVVDQQRIHNECLIDFKLRYGKDFNSPPSTSSH